MKRCNRLITTAGMIGALVLVLLASCSLGTTQEARLEQFKSDIVAGNNTRDNFQGHINASTIDSDTFGPLSGLSIYDCTSGQGGSFTVGGTTITGATTFEIDYKDGLDASHTADGEFFLVETPLGEEWYIRIINVDFVQFPAD